LKVENVPDSQEYQFGMSFPYFSMGLMRIKRTASHIYDLNQFWPVFDKNLRSILCF
jgi:hypothetical protein